MIPSPLKKQRLSLHRAAVMLSLFAGISACHAAGAQPAGSTATSFQWGTFLGPFHMVVLHLPIGFLSLAAILEAWFWWRRVPWARQANTLVLPVAALSAVAAAGLGWLRAGAGEFDPQLLNLHRWSGVALAVAAVLTTFLLPHPDRGTPSRRQVTRFRAAFGVAMALLGLAGHYGGSLTHGSGFLTRGAPSFVRQLAGDAPSAATASAPPTTAAGATAATTGGSDYRTVIQPALQQRCYSCHGPEKQKGKLRLDRRESALVGGESGEPAIQPGDLRKSRLLYQVLLPRQHDDAMPPDGKEPLTPDQILAISRWIQQGAPFE